MPTCNCKTRIILLDFFCEKFICMFVFDMAVNDIDNQLLMNLLFLNCVLS